MLNHKTLFDNYILKHEVITVKLASKIDFNSYDDDFSSFKELRNIIKSVKFSIYKDEDCVFDSDSGKTLDFKMSKEVYKAIKEELCLSEAEAIVFNNKCVHFLNTQSGPMPYELLLAQNLINKVFVFNSTDFESISMRQYEKIQIATTALLKQVEK